MMTRKMLICFWAAVVMGLFSPLCAQYKTDVILTGVPEGSLKQRMERTLADLLTECNVAQSEGRLLRLDDVKFKGRLSSITTRSLTMLWNNVPFRCAETEVIERCLRTPSGYQVRNVPLMMMPKDTASFEDDFYQEAVINFDTQGNVAELYFAIGAHLYSKVIKSNISVTDLRRRQVILDFVENFRTAYNRKDIPFLKQVFSDDALIITGKQVKSVKGDSRQVTLDKSFEYKRQTKQEYIRALSSVFARNKSIKVIFDDIKVVKHPVKNYYYGVTLKQGWRSDHYSDVGYVFLLLDFKDEANPMIHVRTWQPDKYDDGTEVPESKIFSLSDFEC